jgi:DNA-binding XRE family transcriptional regulator
MDVEGFLARLWQLQAAASLNDAELARAIGVNQSTVHRLKKGEREAPHLRTLLGAIREFPELAVFVSSHVRRGNGIMRQRKDRAVS